MQQGEALEICSLQSVLQNAAFAKAEGIDLEMFPITGEDGQIVAEIVQFGAVGAGCEYPELAYEFLRLLLTEDMQWDKANPSLFDDMNDYMLFNGYSVRTEGSAAIYYQTLYEKASQQRYMQANNEISDTPANRLALVELADEDVPILQRGIDVARYPLPSLEMEFGWSIFGSYDSAENVPAADYIAEDFINRLKQHLQGE